MLDRLLKRKNSEGLSPNSTFDEERQKVYEIADEELRTKVLKEYEREGKRVVEEDSKQANLVAPYRQEMLEKGEEVDLRQLPNLLKE